MIVGYDWGNYMAKICTPFLIKTFHSNIISWQDHWIDFAPGKNDFVFEYNRKKGITGQIAFDEKTEIDTNKKGDTKLHEDALIRLLVGLHQFADEEVKVVVGQPINQHKRDKESLVEMLVGKHKIKVNGITKLIKITDAVIGVEGATAILGNPEAGIVHLIDIGSGTINLATIKNGRFINTQSDTIPKGLENLKRDPHSIVANISNFTSDLGWKPNEKVYLLGGGAHALKDYMDYPLFAPLLNGQVHDPVVANAIGFYKLGENIWSNVKR